MATDVGAIISANQNFASSAVFAFEGDIQQLQSTINNVDFPTEFETDVNIDGLVENLQDTAEDLIEDLAELDAFDGTLELPDNQPELAELVEPYEAQLVTTEFTAPTLSTSGLFTRSRPSAFGENAPTEPTGLGDPLTTVREPDIATISDPSLDPITVPTFNRNIVLPVFDEAGPTAPPEAPTGLQQTFDDAYDRMIPEMKAFVDQCTDAFIEKFAPGNLARMEALEDRIEAYLQGGSGLDAQVEQAIYDRGRGRVHEENRAAEQTAWDQAAQRGYTLPPGVLTRELRRSGADGASRNGQIAMDIVKLQGELEQKNLQFAVQQAINLRTQIRNAAIQYAGQLLQINRDALSYAQAIVDVIIRVYETAVRAWEASVRYLEARIRLFEARLRASLAEVEIFEAEVRAAGLQVQINQQKLDTFKSRIEIENTKISLFAAQINAVRLEIERRQGLIQVYQGQVSAFQAKVQAKNSEFGAYEAAIRGDTAKLQGEIAKIDIFKAQLEGANAKNSAEIQKQQATVATNESIVALFRAELEAWLAEYDVNKSQFGADLEIHKDRIRTFRDMAQNQVSQRQLLLNYNQSLVNLQSRLLQAETTAFDATIDGLVGQVDAQVKGAVAQATVSGNFAAGAVAAQNTLVQVAETIQG